MLSQKDVKSLHKKNKSGRLMLSQKVTKRPGWNHEIAIGWRSKIRIYFHTYYLVELVVDTAYT